MDRIRFSLKDQCLVVVFEDPASRNSFSLQAAEELDRCLQSQAGAFTSLIFSAPGRVFCSGGNLTDYAAMKNPDEGKAVNRRITEILQRVSRLETPTVCAVGGDCFGGGLELLSAFDHVIAASHAFFGLWQRKIGLSFGWGGGERLGHRLGLATLRRLALSTQVLDAHEARRLGLIDEVVVQETLMKNAEECARRLAHLPKTPIGPLKAWAPGREQEIFESLWMNDEHRRVLKTRAGDRS